MSGVVRRADDPGVGYVLRGLLAAGPVAHVLAGRLAGAVVDVGQGLALVPGPPVDPDEPVGDVDEVWWGLVARVEDVARAASVAGPVAYVEAEYFGGTGSQAAVVYRHGLVEVGPLSSDGPPGRSSPINAVLRHLGVTAPRGQDEFEALALGRHRHVEHWYPTTP